MFTSTILSLVICVLGCAHGLVVPRGRIPSFQLKMASSAVEPKGKSGVSAPFGFFDPLDLCPRDVKTFGKYKESELKHGRVAMVSFVGLLFGEKLPFLFGNDINAIGINQYQQAEQFLPAWSANVIGLALAVEGFNIVKGWQPVSETIDDELKGEFGNVGLRPDYVNGDLKFDPLGLKPKDAAAFKEMATKEINNGRLAMISVAGIVVQELVTGKATF